MGIINAPLSPTHDSRLSAMMAAMAYDKSYIKAVVNLPDHHAALAEVAHESAAKTRSPFWNEANDVVLLFTGEERPARGVKERLLRSGHEFDPASSAYLVHLYEEEGPSFVASINGLFAGVLVDCRRNQIFLFNDRYGMGRIYYTQNGEEFVFASEAKAILKVVPSCRQIDPRGFAEQVALGCCLENRSLFSQISLLPPASCWIIHPHAPIVRQSYFSFAPWLDQSSLSPDEFLATYCATLQRIVPEYFSPLGGVGLSLTGGLDSRLLAAWAPHQPYYIPCYTFNGPYRLCHDAKIGRQVARLWQQSHQVINTTKAFLNEFPALAKQSVYISDGAQDVTGAANLFVNRIANTIAPTRITGNYGDEILRENSVLKYRPSDLSVYQPDFRSSIITAGQSAQLQSGLAGILQQQLPWFHPNRNVVEHSALRLRHPFLDNEIVQLQCRCPPPFRRSVTFALRLIAAGSPALATLGTDRGHRHPSIFGWSKLAEVSYALSAKAEYYCDYGQPDSVANHLHRLRFLDPSRFILGQNKFYHFRLWYKNELARYLKDILLDPRAQQREYLFAPAVEKTVLGHLSGRINATLLLHRLLSYELTQRYLIGIK